MFAGASMTVEPVTARTEPSALGGVLCILHDRSKMDKLQERYRDSGGVVVDVAFKRRWAVEQRAVKDFPV